MDEEIIGPLVAMCIEAATASKDFVEVWRLQHRTLDRLPSHLADEILRRLRQRRLLYPSLLEVFQLSVEEVDLSGEGCVDAEWLAYLGGFRYLRRLNLADCKRITDSAIWPLSGMTSLKELDLSRCSKVTDAGIRDLLSSTNMEKLYISETRVMLLNWFRNLQVLDMGGIPVTNEAFCSLQCLTELEYLDIRGSKVFDVGARVLELFPRLSSLNVSLTKITKLPIIPSLTFLNMSYCDIETIFYGEADVKVSLSKLLVHGANFVSLEKAFLNVQLSCITYLDLSDDMYDTICDFNILEEMNGLEHLGLCFSQMTDYFMRCVGNVGRNLRYLNLSDTKITTHGIVELVGDVDNLETLLLSHTPIDDMALAYIGMMPSLKVVDVSKTKIEGVIYSGGINTLEGFFTLNMLQHLSYLESLDLEDIPLSDEAALPLASLKQLESLYLRSDLLSEVSLHAMSSLIKLKRLHFRDAVLTDSGLIAFRPPPMLSLLDLRDCWLLSSESLSSFCTNHPGITVKHKFIPWSDTKSGVGSSSQKFEQEGETEKGCTISK